ncbi:MAG TPA: diguanylate cyclase [Acidimicrobiia bacterium]|nr:diguanylate cyclase [Acidimicrobiia bacterium]
MRWSTRAGPSVTTLRRSWNRSFAVLLALVLVGGTASIAGTHALVGTFRSTAEGVENEATLLAQLRADVATHANLLHSLVEGAPVERALAAAEGSVRAGFQRGIDRSDPDAGRPFLQQGFDRWLALVAVATPVDPSQPVTTLTLGHQALFDGTEELTQLLDRAGAAGRAEARAKLARDARNENRGLAALAALVLLMCALIVRFARQLSTQVIRPVGRLRDSANRLAAGDFDHRVELDRADELGDLAVSFNAMAIAIGGSQRRLTRQANRDSLTGLANRAAFHARLEAALSRPERRQGTQAVLFVDVDDFKDVNDTLGHSAGDDLLCVVAARLRDVVRPGDLVARLGGDEFALLLDGVPDPAVALDIAERAVAAVAAPVEVAGTLAHVGASVGLAMWHDGSDPESLMHEADVAMYTAKGRGKNRVEQYDAVLNPLEAQLLSPTVPRSR